MCNKCQQSSLEPDTPTWMWESDCKVLNWIILSEAQAPQTLMITTEPASLHLAVSYSTLRLLQRRRFVMVRAGADRRGRRGPVIVSSGRLSLSQWNPGGYYSISRSTWRTSGLRCWGEAERSCEQLFCKSSGVCYDSETYLQSFL